MDSSKNYASLKEKACNLELQNRLVIIYCKNRSNGKPIDVSLSVIPTYIVPLSEPMIM